MASKQTRDVKCCYLNCTDLGPLDARIEVKTLLPKHGLDKLKSELLVKWRQSGEAEFHVRCWETIYELSRQRTKSDKVTSMCKEEKALVKAAADAPEQYDSIDDILNKARRAAELVKRSQHCVAFTGAGISTSAGIGDYRGKAGKWTEEDQSTVDMDQVFAGTSQEPVQNSNREPVNKKKQKPVNKNREPDNCKIQEPVDKKKEPVYSKKRKPAKDENNRADDMKNAENQSETEDEGEEDDGVAYERLRPTYTHEALYKLMESGYLHYVISQNGDGLHDLSGITSDKIAELHGNVFKEYCEKCGRLYERKFYVMDDVGSQYFEEMEDFGASSVKKPRYARKCDLCGLSHRTGRKCQIKSCCGFLRDMIINFRDLLDEDILSHAREESEQCDVMICLGTTLQVTPACDLVKKVKDTNKLIICNRQETPMDHKLTKRSKDGATRGCRVFGDCDLFMQEMMKHIYPENELKAWELGRNSRLKHYDSLRD